MKHLFRFSAARRYARHFELLTCDLYIILWFKVLDIVWYHQLYFVTTILGGSRLNCKHQNSQMNAFILFNESTAFWYWLVLYERHPGNVHTVSEVHRRVLTNSLLGHYKFQYNYIMSNSLSFIQDYFINEMKYGPTLHTWLSLCFFLHWVLFFPAPRHENSPF